MGKIVYFGVFWNGKEWFVFIFSWWILFVKEIYIYGYIKRNIICGIL